MTRRSAARLPLPLTSLVLTSLLCACGASDSSTSVLDAAMSGGGSPSSGGVSGSSGGAKGSGGAISVGGTTGTAVTGGGGGHLGQGGWLDGGLGNGGSMGTGGGAGASVSGSGGRVGSGGSGAVGGGGKTGSGGGGAGGSTALDAGTGAVQASGGSGGTGGTAGLDAGVRNDGAGGGSGDYGFSFRVPTTRKITCPDGMYSSIELDADWLCTFHKGGANAYVYVQSTPTSLDCSTDTPLLSYVTGTAQVSIDGTISNLSDARLDYGGVHHAESLAFSYLGRTYRYFHSSISATYRPCQPMDCIIVYAAGSTTVIETDGCTSARSIPEVCVQIESDGSHDPLAPDPFKKCAGDPGE